MRKSVPAIAGLCAIGTIAHAASGDIDLNIVVDEGVAHIDHSLPTNDVHTFGLNPYNIPAQDQGGITALVSGANSMSRYGLHGHEDFGSGISVFLRSKGLSIPVPAILPTMAKPF